MVGCRHCRRTYVEADAWRRAAKRGHARRPVSRRRWFVEALDAAVGMVDARSMCSGRTGGGGSRSAATLGRRGAIGQAAEVRHGSSRRCSVCGGEDENGATTRSKMVGQFLFDAGGRVAVYRHGMANTGAASSGATLTRLVLPGRSRDGGRRRGNWW
ncbi:putative pollen-specific leucine-rich repeat extensin-like protein 3 [Iris pallida]|uniref:Pollen-specific leucine-rich repeat extensin-like protein 3 n=1 Tax=Iris pallida TaxID=29817 RepID=A0AAX6EV96_IRIPA|nr:putative pollen-specific leucine-rich repeat extensin-like protein 3 [Iris pallida]